MIFFFAIIIKLLELHILVFNPRIYVIQWPDRDKQGQWQRKTGSLLIFHWKLWRIFYFPEDTNECTKSKQFIYYKCTHLIYFLSYIVKISFSLKSNISKNVNFFILRDYFCFLLKNKNIFFSFKNIFFLRKLYLPKWNRN